MIFLLLHSAACPPIGGWQRGPRGCGVLRPEREHIDKNVDQRITVEELTRVANFSIYHFIRAFKQWVGVRHMSIQCDDAWKERRNCFPIKVRRFQKLHLQQALPIKAILRGAFVSTSACRRQLEQMWHVLQT